VEVPVSEPSTSSSRAVVAFAGRRVDPDNPEAVRFPFKNKDALCAVISDVLKVKRADVLIASAACGSDLMALQAASDLGLKTRIVLPFAPETFRQTSVTDRPNPEVWGRLYDRLTAEAASRGDLIVLDCDAGEDSAYTAANKAIVEEAVRTAAATVLPMRRLALIAWEGAIRGPQDATVDFADRARDQGFTVKAISTLAPESPLAPFRSFQQDAEKR
jgi:hypothetical protein